MPRPAPNSKICVACKTDLPITAYTKPPGVGNKYASRCTACTQRIQAQLGHEATERAQGLQTCTVCSAQKPLTEYASRGGTRSAELHRRCRACMNGYSAVHYIHSRGREEQRAAATLARLQASGETKTCPMCQKSHALDQFVRDSRSTDGLKRICRTCNEPVAQEYRNREEVKTREAVRLRDSNLQTHYGLTTEISELISAAQDHKCANPACNAVRSDLETSKGWHLDHDHITGKTRGILCRACNVALGNAGDNTDVLLGLVWFKTTHDAETADVPEPGDSADVWTTFLAKGPRIDTAAWRVFLAEGSKAQTLAAKKKGPV